MRNDTATTRTEPPRRVFSLVRVLLLGGAVALLAAACSAAPAGRREDPRPDPPGGGPSGAPLSVAGGDMHSVAVDEAGTVWAWGNNALGQLGVGLSTVQSASPLKVPGLPTIVQAAAGANHVLALASDSTVWAWGSDGGGQVGPNGTGDPLQPQRTPVKVDGVVGAKAVAAAGNQSLALLNDGTVMAWGLNVDGELGQGTFSAGSATPTEVPGLVDVIALAAGGTGAGGHVLALTSSGTVWAWGSNRSGQLGADIAYPALATPVEVPGIATATEVAAGSAFSLALLDDGTVVAWGANSVGQLGRGATTPAFALAPAPVAGVSGVAHLAAGLQHVLALRTDGTVVAWGGNGMGQLGRGTTAGYSPDAQPVVALPEATTIAAGAYHSLAITSGLWGWGSNLTAQLAGTDTASNRGTPAAIW